MEITGCCEDKDCQITQIMPPGEWVIYCSDPAEGEHVPLIGFGLKQCGSVIPLVHNGEFGIGEVYTRVWLESEDLYHPLYKSG
jgi:hypothetical protein